ncbi:protein-export membrane protein SecD [Yoonia maricola]|uniref:Protein-export membrane protein SecD n=1 Tax=Yoonia maricola TaxID=420999 RepID=A0A2M8WMP5_9RHOB|nr:hypothetical protein [Yoonia maricola]PJI92204.1 protein-export membrane protein SecD [Yoonia maricola]
MPTNSYADTPPQDGLHLVLEVDLAEAHAAALDDFWPSVRDALAAARDDVGFVVREDSPPGQLHVSITNEAGIETATEIVRALGAPVAAAQTNIDVQTKGAMLMITLNSAQIATLDAVTLSHTVDALRQRLYEAGASDVLVAHQDGARIGVAVIGPMQSDEIISLLRATARLGFHTVIGTSADADSDPGTGNMLVPSRQDPALFYIIARRPVVTGKDFADVQVRPEQNGSSSVTFRLNAFATQRFGQYTGDNIGSPFAIVLNDEVISAPVIQSQIPGGSGIIAGHFTHAEAVNLVNMLRAGPLPGALTVISERPIGPPVVAGE